MLGTCQQDENIAVQGKTCTNLPSTISQMEIRDVGRTPVAVGKMPERSEVGTPTEINDDNPPGRMLTALPLRMAMFNS